MADLRTGLPAGSAGRIVPARHTASDPGDQRPLRSEGARREYWKMTAGGGDPAGSGEGPISSESPTGQTRQATGHAATWPPYGNDPLAVSFLVPRWNSGGEPCRESVLIRNHCHHSPASGIQQQPGHPFLSPKAQSVGCVFALRSSPPTAPRRVSSLTAPPRSGSCLQLWGGRAWPDHHK